MASNSVLREHVHTILRRASIEGLMFEQILVELRVDPDWTYVDRHDLRAVLNELVREDRVVEDRVSGRYHLRESV